MRDPSPYAGQTIKLRPGAAELGGHDIAVVDWYERTGAGVTWAQGLEAGDPRAIGYSVRRGLGGLPDDDDVLFGRVDGMGVLVHESELDVAGAAPAPAARSGPKPVHEEAVGLPCPACSVELAAADVVAALPIGPGPDPAARAAARAGRPYASVVLELHWVCATGDDSYTTTEG